MDFAIICLMLVLVLSLGSWAVGYYAAPIEGTSIWKNFVGLLVLSLIVVAVILALSAFHVENLRGG